MAFPTTPILDDFDRANEGPPPSASWLTPGDPGDFNGLRVVSNAMTIDSGKPNGWSYWNTSYGPDCEFYFTVPNMPSANPALKLFLRLDAPIFGGTTKGYYIDVLAGQIALVRYSDDSILHTELLTVSSGDKIGVSAVGSLITVYQDTGGGWVELFNETDTDYTGAGYTAFFLADPGIIDDFGGGTLGGGGPNPPVADFSGTPTSGDASLSVDFTDLSTNTPTSWAWDFGDSGTSTDQNPTHIYITPGTYTVELTATNGDGSDTETKTDYITVTTPSAPVADFSGVPVTGPAPYAVYFTDLSTNIPTSWAWDFGDTETSTDQNPIHVYTTPGVYTVALTATNTGGSDTETKVDYITVFGAPVANFSGTPTSGTVSLSVDFTDLSTNTPTIWYWYFGDGGTATTQNPTHVYNTIGVYTVALTAGNLYGGDSETKYAYITVTDIAEVGPAEIESCDIDTGGLATGLRVADVAIARDNRLGSVVIDVSAELRVKDNSYTTLTLNGTLTSLAGDRSVWDVANFATAHASDIADTTFTYHRNPALAATFTVSNPVTLHTIDLSAFTLNELAAIVATLLADLGMT